MQNGTKTLDNQSKEDRRPPWKPSRATSRASANCGKEMIRVRFQAVFYIPDAWLEDDHIANKSNDARGSCSIVPA